MVASGIVSQTEMTGHMPMITQKLSKIFHSLDLDQISDICSFGVSIGFLPLIRIIWIKECLFWRFEEKSVHIWWSYVTKCTSLKFPKFHLYMHVSIVELACDNQFSKLSDEHDRSYWTKCHYKLSNHINHIFWHHGCIGHHESDRNDRSHAYVYWKIKRDLLLFDSDQISDVCSFGVSIGFLPLIRIVWIKECLFWRFEEHLCTFDEVMSQNVQFSNFQNFVCTCMSALLS